MLGARHVGASHKRDRIWIVGAYANRDGLEGGAIPSSTKGWNAYHQRISALVQNPPWPDVSNPHAYGSNHGLANRMERSRAIGNGQVPAVVRLAWHVLSTPRRSERAEINL